MNLLIRSTSFLLNDNLAWEKISNNKILFSEYNDLFSNFKNKKFDYEILLIFSKDFIDQFSLNQSLQNKKINKLIEAIKSKSKLNKNTKYLIFFSSYYFNNISENLKSNLNNDYKKKIF